MDGTEDHHAVLGAGDGDIQASLATHAIERSEVHVELAVCVWGIAHGEENHIPLVALDIFEILDEEWLREAVAEVFLELRVVGAELLEAVLDEFALRDVEGHDADGALRLCGVGEHLGDVGDDGIRLGGVGAGSTVENRIGHELEMHAEQGRVLGSGEGVELVVVVVLVAEGDE